MARGGNRRHGVLAEGARFVRAFLAHPARVGAVWPTSTRTVRQMLDMADLDGADLIVELGAGTGVYTEELLGRVPPGARVLAFEIDPELARRLSERLRDERLQVVSGSAERLGDHLGDAQADVIVSALPFTSLPTDTRERLFEQITTALAPEGVFLAIQYSTTRLSELERRFAAISRRRAALNGPPAFVYAGRQPRGAGADR